MEGERRPAGDRDVLLPPSPRLTDLLGDQPVTAVHDPGPRRLDRRPARSPSSATGAGRRERRQPGPGQLHAQVAASGARFMRHRRRQRVPVGSQTNYGDLQQTRRRHQRDLRAVLLGRAGEHRCRSSPPSATTASAASTHTDITNWPQDVAVATLRRPLPERLVLLRERHDSANYASDWYAFERRHRARSTCSTPRGATPTRGTAHPVRQRCRGPLGARARPEYQWLLNDLAAHPSGLKFAFFHYPLYSDNTARASDTSLQGTRASRDSSASTA